jgi:hypothetical protein
MPLRWPIVALLTAAPIGLVVALAMAGRHHVSAESAQPTLAGPTAQLRSHRGARRSKILTAAGYAAITRFVRVGMRYPAATTSGKQFRKGCSSLPSSGDRVAADVRVTCLRVAAERQTIKQIRACGTKGGPEAVDCLDTSLGELSQEMRGNLHANNDILASLKAGRCRRFLKGEGTAADRRLISANDQLTTVLGTGAGPAGLQAALLKWQRAAQAVDKNASQAGNNPGKFLHALGVCRP